MPRQRKRIWSCSSRATPESGAECGEEFFDGTFIRVENGKTLCLACADLGHLEFLARGDPALTRRASKHSPLRAVVVQWSRTRQRYERQGVLVTSEGDHPGGGRVLRRRRHTSAKP